MAEPGGWFAGKLAVVTGGGSGMGRALARQLAAAGCSVATCDWHADAVAETAELARADAAPEIQVTGHECDVSDEGQVLRFRDELVAQHGRDHVDLVFANAGIGGGGSFVNDSREDWERVFANDWWSVYHCARAFLPLLIASGDGVLVNTSSVNGLWASLGPGMTNSAYATRADDRGPAGGAAPAPGPGRAGQGRPAAREPVPGGASGTRLRSPRPRRRPPSWTACGPAPGGSWSARTPP
jgi:NAD(P)-dependent dehydrogenase (short-subunit alcohol dehydrogenase family)